MSLYKIAEIVGAEKPAKDADVLGVAVDSRKVRPGDIFCAVKGARADGHDFVGQAAEAGAAAALVSRAVDADIPQLQVDSPTNALAQIAGHMRASFAGPVVAITGSVGKTSVKEFIASGLAQFAPVLKSEGNLNTEYGIPMTWMQLTDEHKYAVIEMGMRGRGEITHLCEFSRPTAAVITSIGTAHIGELGSQAAIAEAKAEILASIPKDGFAVLPRDSGFFEFLRARTKGQVISFGQTEGADVRLVSSEINLRANQTVAEIRPGGGRIVVNAPGLGVHTAINASAAVAVCIGLGLDVSRFAAGISSAQIPGGRLRWLDWNGVELLVDVYNSSPESCIEALRVLAAAPAQAHVAILGDMLELGDFAEAEHRRIGAFAAECRLDRLSVVGRHAHWIRDEALERGFSGRADWLSSVERAAKVLRDLRPGDVALIKGSRAIGLERALELAGVPNV